MPEINRGIYELTLDELEAMPTIIEGQADDLKIDDGDGYRVWLARVGIDDGNPWDNMVTVEHYDGKRWTEIEHWEAK